MLCKTPRRIVKSPMTTIRTKHTILRREIQDNTKILKDHFLDTCNVVKKLSTSQALRSDHEEPIPPTVTPYIFHPTIIIARMKWIVLQSLVVVKYTYVSSPPLSVSRYFNSCFAPRHLPQRRQGLGDIITYLRYPHGCFDVRCM